MVIGGEGRLRRVASIALGLVAVLGMVGSVVGIWARGTLLDTDRFMAVVRPSLESGAVIHALDVHVTQASFEALQVDQRVEDSLADVDAWIADQVSAFVGEGLSGRVEDPPRLADLAAPLSAAARQKVSESVQQLLATPEVTNLIATSVEEAHRVSVALVRGDHDEVPNLSVDGDVQLDLLPVIARAIEAQGEREVSILGWETSVGAVADSVVPDEAQHRMTDALGVRLGPDFGRVTVLAADTLAWAQRMVRILDLGVWAFMVITGLVATVSVWLSVSRARAVAYLSMASVLALATSLSLTQTLEEEILGLVADPDAAAAASEIVSGVFVGLHWLLGWMIALTALGSVVALLAAASPGRLLLDLSGRRFELRSAVGRLREVALGLIIAVAASVILVTRPGPLGLALFVGLVALAVWFVIWVDTPAGPAERQG